MTTTAGAGQTPIVDEAEFDAFDSKRACIGSVVEAHVARTLELRVQSLEAQVKGLEESHEAITEEMQDFLRLLGRDPEGDWFGVADELTERLAAAEADKAVLVKFICNYGFQRIDHACAQCIPNGEIVVPGFVCGFHLASALDLAQRTAEKEPR